MKLFWKAKPGHTIYIKIYVLQSWKGLSVFFKKTTLAKCCRAIKKFERQTLNDFKKYYFFALKLIFFFFPDYAKAECIF